MTERSDQLTEYLDRWSDSPREDTSRPDLALQILTHIEKLIPENLSAIPTETWHNFLNLTGRCDYLQALPDRDTRYRWAAATDRIILHSRYTLNDMFAERAEAHPEKILFQDMSAMGGAGWSYEVIFNYVREIAGLFYHTNAEPRVAILSNNSIDSACSDLACLMYDILVTPLNIHFDAETLAYIFDALSINIVVTDTEEHFKRLQDVRNMVKKPFTIFTIHSLPSYCDRDISVLHEAAVQVAPDERDELLEKRRRFELTEVCTLMFTSGSTGKPKGVSFSQFNLVSKRFCRAAALPQVGDDEVLLCYLPLFHTFGRYFEMLGTIYWDGTYVFPGNPTVETLLAMLVQINPTGLISVPVRWLQIQEQCAQRMENITAPDLKNQAFRSIVGNRLHWGLSAAGYLSPHIFRFFNNNGVALCSGFGMTEATGGITMTPPGEYHDNSIGIPLPGVDVRLTEESELHISGTYVARYLEDCGPGDLIDPQLDTDDRYWLTTGDLFRRLENGHYEIIDRLKDIYKNNKGQTIAPRRAEKKFEGVSGIKRTFLVGDAREYNVLLIVPEYDDPVLQGFSSDADIREYFHQIVSTANQDLAPYERVVNFDIAKRDFDIEKGELTPKGSYRRKAIENNFAETIGELYRSKFVELRFKDMKIRFPRWFYRDIGILEDDIEVDETGVFNRRNQRRIRIDHCANGNRVCIGDLEYDMDGDIIDMGLLARQPSLWLGNPSLIAFCPCKEGWDTPLAPFSGQVYIPESGAQSAAFFEKPSLYLVQDQRLSVINSQITHAMFDSAEPAIQAVVHIGRALEDADERLARVIRRRLQALATHPEFKVRTTAYRVLLLDDPTPDYSRVLPAFIQSGMAFLDEESIQEIATVNLKKRRLEALRKRLSSYRSQLVWPASDVTRQQFINILKLLSDFANFHPEFYDIIRSELASWILHKDDPEIAKTAETLFEKLYHDYEQRLAEQTPQYSEAEWRSKLIFGDELISDERAAISKVLIGTTFLRQSVILAYDEPGFDLNHVQPGGIWVSRIISRRRYLRYRISINTISGKHFDLQIILGEDVREYKVLETIYWLMTISSYPYGARVLPRLGCCRTDLGARSLMYLGQLTVWEKIREYAGHQSGSGAFKHRISWRKLFVRALATFFKGWRISGERIVPGVVNPDNVVVPEQDFREGASIQSLTDWVYYDNTTSLISPMVQNFFRKTAAHYPWVRALIKIEWIFDACIEELGITAGRTFLSQLLDDLSTRQVNGDSNWFRERVTEYMARLENQYYVPLPLQNAIDRFSEWAEINPAATSEASEQIIHELTRLYRLDRLPEIARYYLYRHTYFADAAENIHEAFDELLQKIFHKPSIPALQMIELSDLQTTLDDPDDRRVFSHMIFPRAPEQQHLDVFAVGESEHKHVIIRTFITDKQGAQYTLREPIEPAEIGQLYRLFFKEGYSKTVTDRDRFLLVVDNHDQVIGGLCYRRDGDEIVHLDGSVIAAPLMGRGIGGALLEDFCARMATQGIRVVKTHFFLRRFYTARGFEVDTRWGALVRFLDKKEDVE